MTAEPVDFVDASRRETILRWKRRTKRVALARLLLPITGAVILLAILGWIGVHSLLPGLAEISADGAVIRMINPQFYGRDDRGRAFLLGAAEAMRGDADNRRITLSAPIFSLGSGRVTAKNGIYREGADRVELLGDVVFIDGAGGRMETQEAWINTRTGRITNGVLGKGVEIASPMGQVRADAYSIGKNGEVVFRGNVHGRINPR